MERRRVVIEATPDFIASLCKSTGDDCLILNIDGVPKDSEFIGATYLFNRDIFQLAFEHESFDEVDVGCLAPTKMVKFTKYYV